MTEQEIIKAIAESQGYQNVQPRFLGFVGGLEPDIDCMVRVPDYPSDLNAMHAVEKTLCIYSKRKKFRECLREVVSQNAGLESWMQVCIEECISATAGQRAEAYLRAIGKWV